MKPTRAALALTAYALAIAAANWLTARYGLVSAGFGLMATAGTYAAGLAFVARDAVQDTAGRIGVLLALLGGAVASWLLATPALALASAIAFGLSELVDMAIYTPLRKRGYVRAAFASNLFGSIADTLLFLWIAGFGLAPQVVAGQLLVKVVWVTGSAIGLVMITRALLRHRIRTDHA